MMYTVVVAGGGGIRVRGVLLMSVSVCSLDVLDRPFKYFTYGL